MDTHASQSFDSPEAALERLETSIEETLHRLIDGGRIDTHHRESADDFRSRVADMRQRLKGRRAAALPANVKSDFDLLAWDFKRWIEHLDREFESPPVHPLGLGRGAPG